MVAAFESRALAGVGTVAEPRWAPDGRRLAWVRATALGAVLVVDGVAVPDVVPAGTRGGTFCWLDAQRLLVVGDGGLRVVRADGAGPGTLLAAATGRAAAPAVGAGLVAYVDETDETCRIVVEPIDGSRDPRSVSSADWAWDPAWSPDGRRLAWHEWDAPDMPWDGSRIVVADLAAGTTEVVAGGPGEAVGQPRFSPDGRRLGFVSDRDGWTNVMIAAADGRDAVGLTEAHEHAEPSWGPGQRSYAWSPDGRRLAWCRNEHGFGRLLAAPTPASGVTASPQGGPGDAGVERGRGWHHGLDWGPRGLAAVRSGARTAPEVVVVDGDPPERSVLDRAAGVGALPVDAFVEPRPVAWTAADGTEIPGLLFVPDGGDGPPPLLVHLHGGPTDQTRVEWAPRLQFYVGRGYAVLAPNPRGSTGYGRAFTRALRGGWGDVDVDDVLAGIDAAVDRGWGDPARVALVGGSAGGFAALLAAGRAPDRVRAVVATYPVTDLVALAAATHRFERHANDVLLGPRPAADPIWRSRSPIVAARAVRVPVLVLQGDADPVVPLGQTRAFVDAVRAAGGDIDLHVYPGEGHGWSRPETVADALGRSVAFLADRMAPT